MPRLICIYGGTFDPVHFGHLKPLSELQQQLKADEVYIIPASVPPHRPQPQASGEQRREMLQLALNDYPEFTLDARELERSGPSWTVLTLQSFRQQYPDDRLCLVMGSDAFINLPTWYHWQEIFQLAHIIVVERGGEAPVAMPDWAVQFQLDEMSDLREKTSAGIWVVNLTAYEMSATAIRQRIKNGHEIKGMLSDQVIAYIRQNKLYQD